MALKTKNLTNFSEIIDDLSFQLAYNYFMNSFGDTDKEQIFLGEIFKDVPVSVESNELIDRFKKYEILLTIEKSDCWSLLINSDLEFICESFDDSFFKIQLKKNPKGILSCESDSQEKNSSLLQSLQYLIKL